MDSGKPQKQALAIAYNVMKKNRKKMAAGGEIETTNESGINHPRDYAKTLEAAQVPPKKKRLMESPKKSDETGITPDDTYMDYPGDTDPKGSVRMASGGIAVHPMHMAHLIMAKKMASGGMADDCYAEGGEVDDSDFDNSDSESPSLPFDDEDAVGIPSLGYDSPREDIEGMHEQAEDPKMKRKKMLSGIMRNLHTGK